jgi:hypothetical protein
VTATVPRDCWVDRLVQWWESVRPRFPHLTTLVLTGDHGPENHRRRTQCMPRMVALVQPDRVTVCLTSAPPSHSKDPPIERCWGILANHWHGSRLDSLDTVRQCAATMPWQGTPPIVALVTTIDQTGIP